MSDYSDEDLNDFYDSDDAAGIEDFEDDATRHVFSEKNNNKGKEVDIVVPHESYSSENLRVRIDQEVKDIVSILGVDQGLALVLLLYFRWNRDKFMESFTESPSKILAIVGEPYEEEEEEDSGNEMTVADDETQPHPRIAPSVRSESSNGFVMNKIKTVFKNVKTPSRKRSRNNPSPLVVLDIPPSTGSGNVCGVCFDDLPNSEDQDNQDCTPWIRCGHRFCRTCWESYLNCKIREEGTCFVRCMAEKCKTALYEDFIKSIVEAQVYERWETLLCQSYVSASPSFRFCPAPSCTETVHCITAPIGSSCLLTCVPTVTCSRGHTFCFGCGLENGHTPVICLIADKWISSKDDSGTAHWISANTRKCPKCNNSIEKAGGCNRMVCRHCRYQFCWMCMKKWDVHGYNDTVCNAFVEPPRTSDMNEAKLNLDRWLFYYDRFNNHEISAWLDQELVEKTQEKMTEIQQNSGLSWIETYFMQSAVDELNKCRQTLKWTYAMAHFLSAGNKKQMFEDIQADLEKAVEHLSQLIDEPIDEQSIKELKQQVIDKTIYVQKRHKIMLTDVAKGLADGTWEWTISFD